MSLVRLVPWVVHSAVEHAAAVLLLLAPFLFAFDTGTAQWTSIALGVVVLLGVAHAALSMLTRVPRRTAA